MSSSAGKRGALKASVIIPQFVAALCSGLTVEQAAKKCEISKSTGYRLTENPKFIEAMNRTREGLFAAIGDSVTRDCRAMVRELKKIAQDPEKDERARVQAARTFLDFTLRFRVDRIEQKLEAKLAVFEQWMAEQKERMAREAEGG